MSLLNAHKRMAGAAESGDFGVAKFPSRPKTMVSPSDGVGAHLEDGSRGAPPGLKKGAGYAMQAAPDHGPVPDHFDRGGKL